MISLKNICTAGALMCFIALAGCGSKNSWLKGVNVATSEQGGSLLLSVKAYLNTGDIPLPATDLPIPNPQDSNDIWGRVAIRPIAGTTDTELEITGNLDKIPKTSNCAGGSDKLPNGLKIPITVNMANLICLNVANSKAMVYIAADLSTRTIMVGTAVPIKQFDDITSKLPDANAFLKFKYGKISGNFGAFTGTQPGQNGIAFFADASGALGGKISPAAFKENMSFYKGYILRQKLLELEESGETLTFH